MSRRNRISRGAVIADPAISYSIRANDNQFGVYAQDQIKLNKWNFLWGIRGDWARSETTDRLAVSTTEQSDSALTNRFAVLYAFGGGISPYASYSESFQPTIGTDFAGKAFNPTRGRQEEAGLKYQPKGLTAFFTASLFNLAETNVLTTDPDHPLFSIQRGEVRSRGLELEAHAEPVRGLKFVASYTWLSPTITKSDDGYEGNIFPGFAPHSFSIFPSYTFERGALRGFGFGMGVRYRNSFFADNANTVKVPAAAISDLEAHYDLGGRNHEKLARLSVNINNLFDKSYITWGNDYGAYYGLRRTVNLTVSHAW